ncbi:hypothetical protein O181_015107 [Austropuccinia psidii MF-1]|uniref:Uncharacterized protein n=1 Tax=Austropuccinia psidii MF-1 TaxID=1389203 RepID=A0A9Q3GQG6_9BASI|nr:hypothetical protein [Austropuccinia psidii MF-1]
MSHAYAPAPATARAPTPAPATAQALTHAHTTAQAPETKPAPPTRGCTCVARNCLMPIVIRPSHSLPLCACVTPMHPQYCVAGSTSVTRKMSIPLRQSSLMDGLGSHTPLLYIKTG